VKFPKTNIKFTITQQFDKIVIIYTISSYVITILYSVVLQMHFERKTALSKETTGALI
jgi:hypothetical protein